jgi:hypothetical protein
MTTTDKRPHPGELLRLAFELINDRGNDYDNATNIEQNYREIAAVASTVIGKALTAREVALILHCVKLVRMKSSPDKLDTYVDAMNYLAFAACFNGLVPMAPLGASTPTSTPKPNLKLSEIAKLEAVGGNSHG